MNNCCCLCHRQTDEIDPVTGVCYECMDSREDVMPEYEDELDDEAAV
jgi:hypothetical protein